MAWKTEMSYQNANSTLWTEPLWFSLSVPRWQHFPTKLVSPLSPTPALHLPPPPAPPSSFPRVFSQSGDLFFISGVRGQPPVIPMWETNLKQLFALYHFTTRAVCRGAALRFHTVWQQPGCILRIDSVEAIEACRGWMLERDWTNILSLHSK